MIDKEWVPCWYCGRTARDPHHAFGGRHRKASDKYGLVFMLCPWCHTDGPENATDHPKGRIAMACKIAAQERFEREIGSREMFVKIFENDVLGD
jgi:hypothetical protein